MLELYIAIILCAKAITAAVCVIGVICIALTHYKRLKRVKNALKSEKGKFQ